MKSDNNMLIELVYAKRCRETIYPLIVHCMLCGKAGLHINCKNKLQEGGIADTLVPYEIEWSFTES